MAGGTLGKFLSLSVPQLLHSKNEDDGGICFSTVRRGIVDLKSNIVPSSYHPVKDWSIVGSTCE